MVSNSERGEVVMHPTIKWNVQYRLPSIVVCSDNIDISKIIDVEGQDSLIKNTEWGNTIVN